MNMKSEFESLLRFELFSLGMEVANGDFEIAIENDDFDYEEVAIKRANRASNRPTSLSAYVPRRLDYEIAMRLGKHFTGMEDGKATFSYIEDDRFRVIVKNSLPGKAYKTAVACGIIQRVTLPAKWVTYQDNIAHTLKTFAEKHLEFVKYHGIATESIDYSVQKYLELETEIAREGGMDHL